MDLFQQSWIDVWEGRAPQEPVGAIFTKPEITRLIFDLSGYEPARERLLLARLLEPSCGDGAFVVEAARRLIAAERLRFPKVDWRDVRLDRAITACDLNEGFVRLARSALSDYLMTEGCPATRALQLGEAWVQHTDFLLSAWPGGFDFVIGNPPYVRIEDLPAGVLQRYRELYVTCADRADLYIAFFEKGLRLLSERGCLAFICANRFAKNLYGRRLRELIARSYHVRYYVNLEHTQPFVTEVSAYPCITVIDRSAGAPTHAAELADLGPETLAALLPEAAGGVRDVFARFQSWYADGAPWISTERKSFDRLQRLADRHPLLEDSADGTTVGIGVATGADEIFVREGRDETIEHECQIPLVMASDISPAALSWSGHYLVNPFQASGEDGLRDLADFPGLCAYFEHHRERLSRRHVAKARPHAWYRTIDRVNQPLAQKPKLVIPDIQAGGVVGFDAGNYYPHHNVYWITSAGWNLRVLQALLRSAVVFEQVQAHSVQMRGGSVRYQAQVLRKLRLPAAAGLTSELAVLLENAASSGDQALLDGLALRAFEG
jgi:methylase of polypeptide subunit release factors